jgi:hypothetical protein
MTEESGDTTADQLLAAAREYDAAVEAGKLPEVEILPEEPEPETEETPPEPQREEVEESPPPDQDTGNSSSLKKEQPEEVADGKEQSKYAKNQVRLNKAWTGVNEAKEQNKQLETQLQKQHQELEYQRQQLAAKNGYRDEDGYTAEDYEDAAVKLDYDGDTKNATAARKQAEELKKASEQAKVDVYKTQRDQAWEAKRQELMTRIPDLRDNSKPLTQKAMALLQHYPSLTAGPDGLELSVEWAKLALESGNSEEAATKFDELQKKYNKLEKKTSVQGGFTAEKLDGARSFEDMDMEDQEKYLIDAAMHLDNDML